MYLEASETREWPFEDPGEMGEGKEDPSELQCMESTALKDTFVPLTTREAFGTCALSLGGP
jgi:hypothetical protein